MKPRIYLNSFFGNQENGPYYTRRAPRIPAGALSPTSGACAVETLSSRSSRIPKYRWTTSPELLFSWLFFSFHTGRNLEYPGQLAAEIDCFGSRKEGNYGIFGLGRVIHSGEMLLPGSYITLLVHAVDCKNIGVYNETSVVESLKLLFLCFSVVWNSHKMVSCRLISWRLIWWMFWMLFLFWAAFKALKEVLPINLPLHNWWKDFGEDIIRLPSSERLDRKL